jgi:murein DD-endopeptidase MepM/ murein hydrolase activator NlpD
MNCAESAIQNSSYLNIKRSLKYENKILYRIKKKIEKLNIGLQKMSSSYMKEIKNHEDLSNKIQNLEKEVNSASKNLTELIDQNKKMALSLVMNKKLGNPKNRKTIVLGSILRASLEKNLISSRKMLLTTGEMKKELAMLTAKSDQMNHRQRELDEKINILEKKKETLAHKFKSTKGKRDEIYYRLKRIKYAKKPSVPTVKMDINPEFFNRLAAPVKTWQSYHFDNKGLTFITGNKSAIFAPNDGKVVYSGNLGAYGYLVIIKNDKDVHTLVLGEIRPTIKKDEKVRSGDKIGVIFSNKSESKVYIEIRKNDRTVSTEKWVKLASFIEKGESV